MAGVKHDAHAAADEAKQYLTFTLAGEMFAFGILRVKEIIEYGHITAVPMMPEFVRGVINLRGNVVPVIDLNARFGRGVSAITRRSCVVILEVGEPPERRELGVVVDAVNEVLDIAPDQIEPAPSFGARIRADFIAGMGKVEGNFVIILDTSKVLSVEDMTLLAKLAGDERVGAVNAA